MYIPDSRSTIVSSDDWIDSAEEALTLAGDFITDGEDERAKLMIAWAQAAATIAVARRTEG